MPIARSASNASQFLSRSRRGGSGAFGADGVEQVRPW